MEKELLKQAWEDSYKKMATAMITNFVTEALTNQNAPAFVNSAKKKLAANLKDADSVFQDAKQIAGF